MFCERELSALASGTGRMENDLVPVSLVQDIPMDRSGRDRVAPLQRRTFRDFLHRCPRMSDSKINRACSTPPCLALQGVLNKVTSSTADTVLKLCDLGVIRCNSEKGTGENNDAHVTRSNGLFNSLRCFST